MKISTITLFFLFVACRLFAQKAYTIESPDKSLSVRFWLDVSGSPFYAVEKDRQKVIEGSQLGLVREDEDFSTKLSLITAASPVVVTDKYEMMNAKRRLLVYQGAKQVFHLKSASGKLLDIIFQVSNDGLGFRYFFPEETSTIQKIRTERSSFHFLPGTKAWLQPMSEAKTGWEQSNPSYEEYYQKEIAVGTPAPTQAGWVYPALFHSGDHWILLSETGLDGNYCASRLAQNAQDGNYSVAFPDAREAFTGGNVFPESTSPWYSPWRIMAIGSLKTIIESTLGTDLAKPAIKMDTSFIRPGIAAWSWVLLKDDSTVYKVQKRFIDYASDMHWKYCLIDADWDRKIGYEKVSELAAYAKTKNVDLILWFNSAGAWNTVKYTPKGHLLTRESRAAEFARLKKMGIKGMKIDFFGGDGQSMIRYYIDIMEEAANYGLLVNFHGATLPRGWQRTYPNLMTMEAIKGMEFITFEQANADEEPAHATTIPFIRNVFDPMDFTPMVLDTIPRIKRRTTSAFELATSVIFLSGIQHMGEIPEGMRRMPAYVKTFLQQLPASWDDVRFIDGYPGKLTVIARKAGNKWYVAGINGESQAKALQLDLSFLSAYKGELFTDGTGEALFTQRSISAAKDTRINIKGNGGFVMVFQQ